MFLSFSYSFHSFIEQGFTECPLCAQHFATYRSVPVLEAHSLGEEIITPMMLTKWHENSMFGELCGWSCEGPLSYSESFKESVPEKRVSSLSPEG